MIGPVTKAVVLAAGRGTRMREDSTVALTDAQRSAAGLGLKPLIPIHGQPFIAWVLTALADAGFTDVCIVVAPGESPVRATLSQLHVRRLRLHFAVQQAPRGSADAVLAAESFAGADDFVVINADNDYPVAALTALRALDGPGLIGFARAGLVRGGIPADRIAAYALADVSAAGELVRIIEKPDVATMHAAGDVAISMTCWRFGPFIFDACRNVPRSARGEHELPDAVTVSLADGVRYRVLPLDAPVLDLSRREDIPVVERALGGRTVVL